MRGARTSSGRAEEGVEAQGERDRERETWECAAAARKRRRWGNKRDNAREIERERW